MSDRFSIVCCPGDQRAVALRLLHDGLPLEEQASLVEVLATLDQQAALDGLWVALEGGEVVAAAWAQLLAGQTAVVWLPDRRSPAAPALMRALSTFLEGERVVLAQFLVSPQVEVPTALAEAGDFQELASLAYLAAQQFPTTRPASALVFLPDASADPERLGQLIVATYVGSQDCPPLNGLRSPEDIVAGYYAQGLFDPQRWFIVQRDHRDVGVLLLTAHATGDCWELVYMGIVPEARGAGLGREILRFALWEAGQAGAQRLVLAVDQANRPASDMYRREGFQPWDFRTVYARIRPTR